MAPLAELHKAQDDMGAHAEQFARSHSPTVREPANFQPAQLAAALVPRRNLVAEFSSMPTAELLIEAQAASHRLALAGRPSDASIVCALMNHLQRKPKLDGALWLPMEASHG